MASEMIRPETTLFLDTMLRDDSTLRVDEVTIGSTTSFRDDTLKACTVLLESGVVLVSMKHGKDKREFIFNPPSKTILRTGDTLVVIGHPEQLTKLREQLSK